MSRNPLRDKLLSLIPLEEEFIKYGGRSTGRIFNDWLSVHSIDREDEHPSAAINVSNDPSKRGIYVDHAPTGKGAKSYFDLLSQLPSSPWMMGREVFRHYLKAYGLDTGEGGKPVRIAPTLSDVEAFQKNLSPETDRKSVV